MSASGQISQLTEEQLRQLRKQRVVWAGMVLSVLLYFAVTLAFPAGVAPTAANLNIERALLIMATAYVAISIPGKRWLLAQAESVDSERLRGAAFIVPLVLCDAAAVTGLVLRYAVGSPHYYAFLLLGLAGMLLNFPRAR